MGGEGQSGIKIFHLTGRKTNENQFPKEINGKGQGPMQDHEEEWLDSISFTADDAHEGFFDFVVDAGNLWTPKLQKKFRESPGAANARHLLLCQPGGR